ncbi:MAG: histidine phosphatase family protein [Butyrivibrio sp.]|nr:histidine phosphatase family protein [Butyrivibrio sp.]
MLYIIRHGETELNSKHVLQGRSNHELNAKGIEQAMKAAKWLESEGISFSKVYSSPLKRAIQTAECITKEATIQTSECITKGEAIQTSGCASDGAAIVIDERLIEMDYGPYEGMSLLKPKKEVLKFFSDFANNPAPEGMEQLSDIVARTGEFVESIKDECSKENVLISTHAIAMKGILEYLDKEAKGKYWSKNISNCEIYKVDCIDGIYGLPESIYKIKKFF